MRGHAHERREVGRAQLDGPFETRTTVSAEAPSFAYSPQGIGEGFEFRPRFSIDRARPERDLVGGGRVRTGNSARALLFNEVDSSLSCIPAAQPTRNAAIAAQQRTAGI